MVDDTGTTAEGRAIAAAEDAIRRHVAGRDGLSVVGLCGAQGSGKSTLASGLARRFGAGCVVLSIDDLYLTRAERLALAAAVHPLLATRGVPGTHDVALGIEVIERLRAGEAVRLPRFDKGRDDRCPEEAWEAAAAGARLLILEGWCVGARPQAAGSLVEPVNTLEAERDADGRWRAYVNDALAGDYRRLFGMIGVQILLAAPGFDVVRGWRTEQEVALRHAGGGGMSDAEIGGFIQHYQRLTEHILAEMPGRADLTIALDVGRNPVRVTRRGG